MLGEYYRNNCNISPGEGGKGNEAIKIGGSRLTQKIKTYACRMVRYQTDRSAKPLI